ncbi:MAG TPA: TetR family transcriptional regulator [Kiloniellales bacterium]|nr:TetR family transcriptional regulator [Kiloniellales bacterium]
MSKREELRPLIDAAMSLAAARPWNEITYRDIVATAGLKLEEAHALAPGKGAILAALSRQADRAVLAEPAAIEDGSARDRLFDVLMRRFDQLKPYRSGLASVAAASGRDPALALGLAANLACSMQAMLVAAGISTEGLVGLLRIKGTAAIWAGTFRTFLRDENDDLSETMASLDRKLRRAESILQRCTWTAARRKSEESEPPPKAEPEEPGPQAQPL